MGIYSRQESVEEKRNFRSATTMIAASLLVVVLLILYGIPAAGRFASFLTGYRHDSTLNPSDDITPPAPPKFNILPDYTKEDKITITGTAEAGVVVKLMFNGEPTEVVSDKSGNFVFQDLVLKPDTNTFYAVAQDTAKNLGVESKSYTVIQDKQVPEINIEDPPDGFSFFGSTQRQINIKGKTEVGANLTLDDRFVTVADDGSFHYPLTLNPGQNTLTFKSTDRAGNLTEKVITLNFSE